MSGINLTKNVELVINDPQEILNHITELNHRMVDCGGFIKVHTSIKVPYIDLFVKEEDSLCFHEFSINDQVTKPVNELGRSIARNQTELCDQVVAKIHSGDITRIGDRPVTLSEELLEALAEE